MRRPGSARTRQCFIKVGADIAQIIRRFKDQLRRFTHNDGTFVHPGKVFGNAGCPLGRLVHAFRNPMRRNGLFLEAGGNAGCWFIDASYRVANAGDRATSLLGNTSISIIGREMSSVAPAVYAANALTSAATAAHPRPVSPARTASMVAFNASRLFCAAIPLMSVTTFPIF